MHAALLPGKRKGINQSPTISTGVKEELKKVRIIPVNWFMLVVFVNKKINTNKKHASLIPTLLMNFNE